MSRNAILHVTLTIKVVAATNQLLQPTSRIPYTTKNKGNVQWTQPSKAFPKSFFVT